MTAAGARAKRDPHPALRAPSPFCPFGTFPPDRGNRPSPSKGEGLRAADSRPYRRRGAYGGRVRTPAPTQIQGWSHSPGAGPRPARGRTMCAPTAENGLGALVRHGQAQPWNGTRGKFCKPRAQWPGRNRTQALLILRAGNVLPTPRGNPRKWGSGGKRSYGHGVPVGRVPRRSFGFFPIAGKETRRPQAAKCPCKKRNRSVIAPSSVTASPCHLPPKGKAFWRSTLIRPFGPPFCPFGTFPPDRGDRPSPSKGEGLRAADSRPYRRRGAYGGRVRTPAPTQIQGRSQTGPRAATWGRPCGGNRPPGEE